MVDNNALTLRYHYTNVKLTQQVSDALPALKILHLKIPRLQTCFRFCHNFIEFNAFDLQGSALQKVNVLQLFRAYYHHTPTSKQERRYKTRTYSKV